MEDEAERKERFHWEGQLRKSGTALNTYPKARVPTHGPTCKKKRDQPPKAPRGSMFNILGGGWIHHVTLDSERGKTKAKM